MPTNTYALLSLNQTTYNTNYSEIPISIWQAESKVLWMLFGDIIFKPNNSFQYILLIYKKF